MAYVCGENTTLLARSLFCKSNSFPYESGLCTRTRFETDAKANPEMAYRVCSLDVIVAILVSPYKIIFINLFC